MKLATKVFTFAPICMGLLLANSAMAFVANVEKQPGVVIPDSEPFPLYRYSKIVSSESEPTPSLHLSITGQQTDRQPEALLLAILENLGISFEQVANSDEIQTDWISWHYDEESKKSQSNPRNNFFSVDFRDRYRFTFSVITEKNRTEIHLKKIVRHEETDITPDTEYIWTEWKQKQPDKNAVHDFLQRLQTEFEKQLFSDNPEPAPVISKPANQLTSNHIQLNMSVKSTWERLIKTLSLQATPLASTHHEQHMLKTDWITRNYASKDPAQAQKSDQQERHRFQIIIVPGATADSSSLYVYHTASQQRVKSNWVDQDTHEAVAAKFLSTIQLTP